MDNEYILELKNITKEFPGVKALDGACLYLHRGSVLALMGGNGAGKSTLMNCLFGSIHKDGGTITYEGRDVNFSNPRHAIAAGISMVHQELQPILDRTIAENLYMGRFPQKKLLGIIPVVDHKKMYADSTELLKRVHLDIDPATLLRELSVGQMQLVEIAKAISTDCKVLIFDEPTSALTSNETEILFSLINELRENGVAMIYISHKMDEIFKISDEIAVMRDGTYVGTWPAAELDNKSVIEKMLGRPMDNIFPEHEHSCGEVLLKVEDLSSIVPGSFKDCSFELHRGEILGVGGLVGAQRTELMEGIFGLRHTRSGKITINGQEVRIKKPSDAIEAGIALLTEDRLGSGILANLSIADNVAIASYQKHLKWNILIDHKAVEEITAENIDKMHIKTVSQATPIGTLSGGNQQKVLIGRILANNPEVFIFDEPTRGIDVGAKYEIYSIMIELAKQGKGIIMVSGSMEELIGMSDRVMVMCNGRITGFASGDTMTERNIMDLSFRFK